MNGFSGPKSFRDVRETGPSSGRNMWLVAAVIIFEWENNLTKFQQWKDKTCISFVRNPEKGSWFWKESFHFPLSVYSILVLRLDTMLSCTRVSVNRVFIEFFCQRPLSSNVPLIFLSREGMATFCYDRSKCPHIVRLLNDLGKFSICV